MAIISVPLRHPLRIAGNAEVRPVNVEGEVQSELGSGLASRRPLSLHPASSFLCWLSAFLLCILLIQVQLY